MNMKRILAMVAICTAPALLPLAVTAETLYPPGSDIYIDYIVSDSAFEPSDTIAITRTLVNHELTPLSSLYFSDNLPPEFNVVSHSISINGSPIAYTVLNAGLNAVLTDLIGYYWIVDDPDSTQPSQTQIAPGDSVVLETRFVCADVGDFVLPQHTTVCHSNSTGLFAIGDSIVLTVNVAAGIEDEHDDSGLFPDNLLTSWAYPTPFNGTVVIVYSGTGLGRKPLKLSIYNIVGQLLFKDEILFPTDDGRWLWQPEATIGSGVYLYKITTVNANAGGKLVLMK